MPTISGYEQGLRRIPPEQVLAIEEAFAEDERSQLRGEPLRRQTIVSADPAVSASYRAKDAIDFYLQPVPPGCTAVGVPARLVNCPSCAEPSKTMDQTLPDSAYDYVI